MAILTFPDLKAKGVDFSAMHIWRLVRAGRFPKPFKLGVDRKYSRNFWDEAEVDAFLASRRASRGAPTSAPFKSEQAAEG